MQKKFITIIFLFLLSLGFSACDKKNDNSSTNPIKYTIIFMNGSSVFDTKEVESGNTVSKPNTNPVKNDYDFDDWFENLNPDGTGNGLAFNFTTKITKNLTLHAAFKESLSFTAFVNVNANIYPFVAQSGLFTPTGYGMETYNYNNYQATLFKESDAPYTLPSNLAYLDVSKQSGNTCEKHYYFDRYLYVNAEVEYIMDVYKDGYTHLQIIDNSENWKNIEHYTFKGKSFAEVYDDGDTYYFVNGESKAYILDDFVDLGDSITVNKEFIDEYCVNGVMVITTSTQLKPDYLGVYLRSDFNDQINVKVSDTIDLSIYDKVGFNASYTYEKLIQAEIVLHSELFNKVHFNAYKAVMSDEYTSVDDNPALNTLLADFDNYCINGTIDSFVVQIDIENYSYTIYVINGEIVSGFLNVLDGQDAGYYDLACNVDTGDVKAYTYQFDVVFTGNKIPQEQFDIFKKLGKYFNITINYTAK